MGSKVWLFADGAQAEARAVAWYGPVPALKSWFQRGDDVHLNVTKMIAEYIQKNDIDMPTITLLDGSKVHLFWSKPYDQLTAENYERQVAKTTVHANNYKMGARKFALVTGLPEAHAKAVQETYFRVLPEVRTGYHALIDSELRRSRTIAIPYGWRRQFFGLLDDDTSRAAYSFLAQSTVGVWMTRLWNDACEVFGRASTLNVTTPEAIRSCGLGVALQVHDALGLVVDNDPETIYWTAKKIKEMAEKPIPLPYSRGELVIPVDFEMGPTWGDLKKVKLSDLEKACQSN